MARAPNSKRRAERLVLHKEPLAVDDNGVSFWIGDVELINNTADSRDEAVERLRRILAREFRKVRRAALRSAAKKLRPDAAAVVMAMAKPRRKGAK